MRISDIKTYVTAPRPANPWLFVEVHTDEGVTGLGECTLYIGNHIISEAVQAVKPLLIGEEPANIEEAWQRIFRRYLRIGGRGIMSAVISAVDMALWDIKGKVLGAPVYQLLGGPLRESVPLYTHVQDASYEGVSPHDATELARRTKAAGYEAIKTDPFKLARSRSGAYRGASFLERLTPRMIDEAVAWVGAVRDAVGPDYELMVDAHARFDVPTAIRAAQAMEQFNLTWFEEPVPPESYEALRQVRENTNIPISVGESLFTRYDFVPVLQQRLADYIMPDVAWTGGISELRRIAALTEAYYLRFSPHDALGPVAIVSAFHVCMTTPNLYRQECLHTWFDDFKKVIKPMFEYHGGAIWPSNRPGLGIELDRDGVAEYAIDPTSDEANRILR